MSSGGGRPRLLAGCGSGRSSLGRDSDAACRCGDRVLITATGRFTYIDDKGAEVGIVPRRVELCDDDTFIGCSLMGTTTTDLNGYFTVVGTGADPDFIVPDLPDVYVRVLAESASGSDKHAESRALLLPVVARPQLAQHHYRVGNHLNCDGYHLPGVGRQRCVRGWRLAYPQQHRRGMALHTQLLAVQPGPGRPPSGHQCGSFQPLHPRWWIGINGATRGTTMSSGGCTASS